MIFKILDVLILKIILRIEADRTLPSYTTLMSENFAIHVLMEFDFANQQDYFILRKFNFVKLRFPTLKH